MAWLAVVSDSRGGLCKQGSGVRVPLAPLGNVPFLILDQEAGSTESLSSVPKL
jgi:hypothetical protein